MALNFSQIEVNNCNVSSSIPFELQDDPGTVTAFTFKRHKEFHNVKHLIDFW